MAALSDESEKQVTLAVLGCGTLGTAIVAGMLKAAATKADVPALLPQRIIATVASQGSVTRLEKDLGPLTSNLEVLVNDNVKAATEANVVLLACKPYMAERILRDKEMSLALQNKLLISILAGVTITQIVDMLNFEPPKDQARHTLIVRVMPNTASAIGHSMSVISSASPLDQSMAEIIDFMFSSIGRVVTLPESLMDVSTALVGSGPAFFALALEAAIDGAVAMGLPRKDAQFMAAQTMKGAAELVLAGEHPAILREKVSGPGGCTIGGLLVLEEGGVRGSVAKAVREATVVAAELGTGAKNVNGTRHR